MARPTAIRTTVLAILGDAIFQSLDHLDLTDWLTRLRPTEQLLVQSGIIIAAALVALAVDYMRERLWQCLIIDRHPLVSATPTPRGRQPRIGTPSSKSWLAIAAMVGLLLALLARWRRRRM